MSYFTHEYISNSDLKSFKQKLGLSHPMPENMQPIFDFGTLFHKVILEPHLVTDADKASPDYKLASKMGETFFKDEICRNFILAADFEREHECYNPITVGPYTIMARCKFDGLRTIMRWSIELKGLAVNTKKAFEEALQRLDYDQGTAHYQLTGDVNVTLIVGISKKRPELLFKRIVKRHDDFFAWGEQKLIDILGKLKEFSPEDFVNV